MHANAYPALVLNADFQPLSYLPLSLWGWQDAVHAVFKGRVQVVAEYDRAIRSPSTEIQLPSVIALRDYVPPPRRAAFTRFNVFLRDRFRCQYCGEPFRANDLTFDHVVPRCDGGRTEWTNIVAACEPCNAGKDNRRLDPLAAPREPSTYELVAAARGFPSNHLHESWADFLYWDTELEQ